MRRRARRLDLAAEEGGGQRPAPLDLGLGAAAPRPEPPAGPRPVAGALGAGEREARSAQRRPRVVGHLARPHEIPERLLDLLGRDRQLGEEVGEEARRLRQARTKQLVLGRVRPLGLVGRRADGLDVVAEIERHAARVAPQGTGADPHELAAGAQLVHPGRRVGATAAWQHVALPDVGGEREALEGHEHLAQAVDPGTGGRMAVDALPRGQEGGQRALVGGLDLLAQDGQRRAAQAPQHLGVAPLALAAGGAQLAAHQLPGALERGQGAGRIDEVALAQLAGREGAVGAREAADDLLQRRLDVGHEGLRQPAGGDRAEGVAVQPRVVGRDPALLAAHAQAHRAPLGFELGQHSGGVEAREHAVGNLDARQVPEPAQDVGQRVARVRARAVRAVLEVELDLLQRGGVDELAQLLLAEELAQQLAVERQRRRAPLGVRRVALVHIRGDVVEEQARGEGRRSRASRPRRR